MTDFISFDAQGMNDDIDKVSRGLDQAAFVVQEATRLAIEAIAKNILAAAQVKLEVQTRSGDLSRSGVVNEATISDGQITISLGFTEKYAAQRDQGGTILPKNGRMLAIPLAPIMTETGSRFDSPLEEDNLELVVILGNVYLVDKTTHEFHWILVPSVTQEGSHYLTGTLQEQGPHVGAVAAQLVKEDIDGRSAA